MLERRFTLMAKFGMSERQVRTGITSARAMVMHNWCKVNESNIWGDRLREKTPGYVQQALRRILKEENGI